MGKERTLEAWKQSIMKLIETASQLDEQSLLQLQFTANVLLARERQVQLLSEKEIMCVEA